MRFLPGQIIRSFYICCGKTKEDQPVEKPGVVKGRLPLKLYSGSDGMHVRTDENLQAFVPCGFCRPGANTRGKTRENSKKWRLATFSTLSKPKYLGLLLICRVLDADYRPISSFTSLKHLTANSRSSLLCPADTWVRIRALPIGTTG